MSTLDGGQRVGRYRIVRFLGAGAMGEVYLAEDPHIERQLAIKTVRLAGGRPQDIEDRKKRLLREARAAGRLLHPNIVTLFDTGEEDGLLYLAFEFVEGCDLASRLEAREPPSLREVLRTVRQVAEALDYAHRQGIVHRDIKPSNILIDPAGHVKVADFGIAKVVGQNTELTVAGSVMGSPQYLSPEQIRGDELDGRSDIFSLGVVLYELLSGRRPFDGETITTLVYQILNKDVSISDLRKVPLRLDQLLHRMLAKDRDDRLATASQVGEELAAIERELSEETLAAPAAPAPESMDATRVLPSRALAVGAAGAPGGPVAAPGGVISASGRIGAIPGGVIAGPATAGPGSGAAPAVAPPATLAPSPVPAVAHPAPAAAAAPQRSSSAKVWLALAAILLVICGALAAGAYMVWQRYLQRVAAQAGQLSQPTSPAAAASQPSSPTSAASQPTSTASQSDRGAATPAPAAPSVPGGGTAGGAAAAGAGSASPSASGQATGGAAPGSGAAPASPGAAPSGAGGTRPGIVVVQPSAASARADRMPSRAPAPAPPRRVGTTAARADSPAAGVAGDAAGGAGDRGGAPAGSAAGSSRSNRPPAASRSNASVGANASGGAAGQPAAEEGEAAAAPASSAGAGSTESVDRVIRSGLELAFRVNPPDAYVLLDGAVIGRAEEWNGQRGGRAFTLPGTGQHLVKIKKPGMKDYRITVEAAATRGTTPVVVNLQPLPAAQVDTSDLQTIRVREAVALRVQPDVNALVLVDGATVGQVKKFGGRFGHGDEWLGLPPGMHRLTLVAPGYGRRDVAVEISPGADKARQKIDVTLTPVGATGNP